MIINVVIVCFFFVILPVVDYFVFLNHIRIQEKSDHKKRYYLYLLLELWVPFILILVFYTNLNIKDYFSFFIPRMINKIMPNAVSIILVCLAYGFVLYILMDTIRVLVSKKYLLKIQRMLDKIKKPTFISKIEPSNKVEYVVFIIISISAGILEEIYYRSVLYKEFTLLLPNTSIVVIAILTSIAFSCGHIYQGISGVIRTFIIGILLSLVYFSSSSIVLCIIIHIGIDVSNTVISWKMKSINESPSPSLAQSISS